jgi:hypothetical protein
MRRLRYCREGRLRLGLGASMQRRMHSDFKKSTIAMTLEHMLMARYNMMLLE